MKTMIAAVLAAVLSLAMAPPPAGRPVTLTARDDLGVVKLSRGQRLQVRLRSQAGWAWQFARRADKVVGFVAETSEGAGVPGGVETQVFHLKGDGLGRTRLRFRQTRPGQASRTFEVTIVVQGGR